MAMAADMKSKLKAFLIRHEGDKRFPYKDIFGFCSIGMGRNLDAKGVLPDEIELMFTNDSEDFFAFLSEAYPFFNGLNEDRQVALVDMAFMGKKHFSSFTNMIGALEKGDYNTAAEEILNSEYARQVGQRAVDIANVIKDGKL